MCVHAFVSVTNEKFADDARLMDPALRIVLNMLAWPLAKTELNRLDIETREWGSATLWSEGKGGVDDGCAQCDERWSAD